MSQVEDMLKEILTAQKRILADLEHQGETIHSIEGRLSKIESQKPRESKERRLPTSLMRVLKELSIEEQSLSADEAAKKVNLSRNLTSGYLNKLAELGYATKEPNLEGSGPRYLFRPNYSALPEYIKEILGRYKR